jgi:YVTN family beta-propeller protein
LDIISRDTPKHLRKSTSVGAVLHSDLKPARALFLAFATLTLGTLTLAGCGNNYRPVVSSINPVGPAGQPTKYAVAISSPSPTSPGLVTLVDFSGDTILNTTAIGANPQYLVLSSGGGTGYTLNGDGTANTFAISTGLLASDVLQSTLLAGSKPVSLYPQGTYVYIAESGRNAVAQLQGNPPAIQQELPTGSGTIYTVGANGSPRAYAIVQGTPGSQGKVAAIETTSNTISNIIPVGVNPVYGVMTADSARAYILNKGSNSVTAINSQTNAPDLFTTPSGVASTIPVGVAPVWADFAPTLSELVVANAGDGTNPGSVSIINIPRCPATTVSTNPTCDPANPLNALGYGQVLATIPVGINPVMVGVMQDGTRAYVANAGNAAAGIAGSISVINLTTNTVIATIPAGTSSNPADSIVHGHPAYIAVTTGTPTGKVYVTSLDSTDITIIRTDTDVVQTHLSLQGNGVAVRITQP